MDPLKRKRPRLYTILLFQAGLLLLSFAAWAKGVGVVSELEGSASLKRAGETSEVVLAMAVQAGDEVSTGADSHLSITLVDDSKLTLDSSSTLVFDEHIFINKNERRVMLHLLGGGVRAVVTPLMGKPAQPDFSADTRNVIAGVRGTDFELTYSDAEMRSEYSDCFQFSDVGVYTGEVEVSNPSTGESPLLLDSGFATTVACTYSPTPPIQLSMHPLWRRHHDNDHHPHDHDHNDHDREHHEFHGSAHPGGHH